VATIICPALSGGFGGGSGGSGGGGRSGGRNFPLHPVDDSSARRDAKQNGFNEWFIKQEGQGEGLVQLGPQGQVQRVAAPSSSYGGPLRAQLNNAFRAWSVQLPVWSATEERGKPQMLAEAWSATERGLPQMPAVGWCKSKPVETRVGSAWFQRLKVNYDKLLSNCAFYFNLRHYTAEAWMRVAECSTELASRGGGPAAPQAQFSTSTHDPWQTVTRKRKGGKLEQPEVSPRNAQPEFSPQFFTGPMVGYAHMELNQNPVGARTRSLYDRRAVISPWRSPRATSASLRRQSGRRRVNTQIPVFTCVY